MINRRSFCACLFMFLCASFLRADDRVTRVYMLKNSEMNNVSRVLNIAVRDTAKTRVVGGEGKRLVVTDTVDQLDAIAQVLPTIDQPVNETDPDKIQMKMLMNVAQAIHDQKMAIKSAPAAASGGPAPLIPPPPTVGGVQTYDKFSSAKPYKSIYASDDAKIVSGPRYLFDEPVLPSFSSLVLKGIFKTHTDSPLALLAYDGVNFTAHDGGLFQNNHDRVKDVTTRVMQDRVILTGKDHIPHEIRFKTTL